MSEYIYNYDAEDDVFYIRDSIKKVYESFQVAEDIVLDLDSENKVIGIEIFYASEFFSLFNKEINKEFLGSLDEASIQYKEYRNNLFVIISMKSGSKVIYQPMPPLRRSEYKNPIYA